MNVSPNTLTKPIVTKTYRTEYVLEGPFEEKTVAETGNAATKVVFVPQDVTPLDEYERGLRQAGYSEELITDIIQGLATNSPLYEGQTS